MKREVVMLQSVCEGPNIIKLYDLLQRTDANVPVMVFEKVNGISEAQFVLLTENETRFYMKKLLQAVEYLHSKNIIHLDLKPANILIDKKLRILKVIDFGLARWQYDGAYHNIPGICS